MKRGGVMCCCSGRIRRRTGTVSVSGRLHGRQKIGLSCGSPVTIDTFSVYVWRAEKFINFTNYFNNFVNVSLK